MSDKIIVSTLIDSQILSLFPNANMDIFYNLESLSDTIKSTPIRTDKLIITQDITNDNPTPTFTLLVNIVNSVFFKTNEILFISNNDSPDLDRLKFLVKNNTLPDVDIVTGNLTKEFVISVIRGDISSSQSSRKRKEVIRMRRQEYIESKKNKSAFSEEDNVELEEDRLTSIENQEREKTVIYDYENNAEIIQITGLSSLVKSAFTDILAQFLSGYGKTLLIETDMEYFTISYLLSLSKIEYLDIPLKIFYSDPLSIIDSIKNTNKKLICLTCTSEDINKNYQVYQIVRALFNLLKKNLQYIVYETDISSILPSMRTIVVMENNLIDILKTIPKLPSNSLVNMQFASIDSSMSQIAIKDSKVITSIVAEMLDVEKEIPVYKINSLSLGGDNTNDLYRYVNGNA